MSGAFRREGDRITCRFKPFEVEVLRGLVNDVQQLIDKDAPDNPMTQRLFPDPSLDPVDATELRALIEDDLREGKRAAARGLLESLADDGRIALDGETAEQWLTALNDVRLALGTALGVTEDMDDDPDNPTLDAYHWLGFLQETLVEAVSAGGVDR